MRLDALLIREKMICYRRMMENKVDRVGVAKQYGDIERDITNSFDFINMINYEMMFN